MEEAEERWRDKVTKARLPHFYPFPFFLDRLKTDLKARIENDRLLQVGARPSPSPLVTRS